MESNIIESTGIKKSFKNVSDILSIIPADVIERFAVQTDVDRHVKLLQGGIVFNTLLHMLLTESKLSQRVAHDVLTGKEQLIPLGAGCRPVKDHTSICRRLQNIKVEYFEKIYDEVRSYATNLYDPTHLLKLHLTAVDSTIIAETCNKLEEGFHIGNKSKDGAQRRHVKVSEVFDGLTVLGVCFNDDRTGQAENNALPQVIAQAAKQDRMHRNLYIIDRGLTKAQTLEEMSGQAADAQDGKLYFLVRISDKRRTEQAEALDNPVSEYHTADGRLVRIVEFNTVRIFRSASSVPDPAIYRHVKAEVFEADANPEKDDPKIVNLLTDVENITAVDMLEAYRRRWMIEVFFKFIKQNLDFSHLLSTSANGLKVMMYMTMIAAMMVLVYARSHEIGFKTAKRRFDIALGNLIIAQSILLAKGDPRNFMNAHDISLPGWHDNDMPPKEEWLRKIVTDYDNVH